MTNINSLTLNSPLNDILTDNSNNNFILNNDDIMNIMNINNENEMYDNIFNILANIVQNNTNNQTVSTGDIAINNQTVSTGDIASVPEISRVVDEDEERPIPKCCICLNNNVSIVFSCGHVCSCNGCCTRVDSCPICRQNITSRRRLFF
jgi:hypothetical protein